MTGEGQIPLGVHGRFGKLALQIWDLNPKVTLHHMVTALRLGSFADSLCKKPVADLDELRRRATIFMQLQELQEFQNQVMTESQIEKVRMKDKLAPLLRSQCQRRHEHQGSLVTLP